MKSDYHLPVLLKESINALKIDDEGIYVDATFGGGGHSLEILRSCLLYTSPSPRD